MVQTDNVNLRPYHREDAVRYAKEWALRRNPKFYDYAALGGDCTNFASQALYAGSGVMNYHPTSGWYYLDPNRKSPSWTGVPFLYDFLIGNRGPGPFAAEVGPETIKPGDLIQLALKQVYRFGHTLVVTEVKGTAPSEIFISSHNRDRLNQPLSVFQWQSIRYLHILGYRVR